MAKEILTDWPVDENLSDTVIDFLIKYPKLINERVVVYWDNFIITNYRLYYKNEDEKIYLVPHYKVKEYILKGKNVLILKLRDKSVLELHGPVPKFDVLKKTYGLKDWRRLSKKEDELLEKTNAELGRIVREKPRKSDKSVTSPNSRPEIDGQFEEKTKVEYERKPIIIAPTGINGANGIFCPHCGFKITVSGARFCPNCGLDLI